MQTNPHTLGQFTLSLFLIFALVCLSISFPPYLSQWRVACFSSVKCETVASFVFLLCLSFFALFWSHMTSRVITLPVCPTPPQIHHLASAGKTRCLGIIWAICNAILSVISVQMVSIKGVPR